MPSKINKTNAGYVYSVDDADWNVCTDYLYQKIYLSEPHSDEDIDAIADFGRAIVMAVQDMRKDMKQSGGVT